MIQFLKTLFGDEVILMSYDYSRSTPGAPAINLHSDGQPWGSKIFGPEHSCPRLVHVLYYLEDLTPERAPFRVVPRSHLSFHNQANPYRSSLLSGCATRTCSALSSSNANACIESPGTHTIEAPLGRGIQFSHDILPVLDSARHEETVTLK